MIKIAIRWAALCLAYVPIACATSELQQFTAADSIAMTRILGIGDSDAAAVAPDGKSAIALLRKGDLKTGMNEYSLVRFDVASVREFVRNRSLRRYPAMDVLLRLRNDSEMPAIEQVRWLNNSKQILLIARTPEHQGIGQVYALGLPTMELRPITKSGRDIKAYVYDESAQLLLYSTEGEIDTRDRDRHGFVVNGQNILEVMAGVDPTAIDLYLLDLAKNRLVRVQFAANERWAGKAFVAPDGHSIVLSSTVSELPAHWAEYEVIQELYGSLPAVTAALGVPGAGASLKEEGVFGSRFTALERLVIADSATGRTRPLLDVPIPQSEYALRAAWSPDGRRFALAPSRLPLAGTSESERKLRRRAVVVLELDFDTGEATRISESAHLRATLPKGIQSRLAPRIEWRGGDSIVIETDEVLLNGSTQTRVERFRKSSSGWARLSSEVLRGRLHQRHDEDPGVEFSVTESVDEAPQIAAQDLSTGNARVITKLNPQLSRLSLGRSESFQWHDSLGRLLSGVLLFPPGYQPQHRYPLVIQTYGGYGFLVDGPATSGFAARPLANRGILVLQLGCSGWGTELSENSGALVCYQGAVDALVNRGLVARDRVGIIGFSRTGMHVLHAVTFGKNLFAAALICDSISDTPYGYALNYGSARPAGMLQWDSEADGSIGAPLFSSGIAKWLKKSSFFNLDLIRAPLRFEDHHSGGGIVLPNSWDIHAVMRRMRRPVELVVFPKDGHNLVTPYARFTSQQGSVDWFGYWLKDEERLAPIPGTPESVESLEEQYARWGALRAERDALPE